MPRFSFVVIAYNVESYIKDCLRSVMAQSLRDIEVVIVDDYSTDNTAAIISDTIRGDQRCRLVRHNENCGAHIARKSGVAQTHGDYVVFVDGDDRVKPDLCERLEEVYQHESPDILRFCREVVSPEISQESVRKLEASFNCDTGHRVDNEILLSVFSDEYHVRGTWSVIDCSFRGEMLRQSFQQMTNHPIGRMQDSYEFFVLADAAKSMQVMREYRGLLYSYGTGVSGDNRQSLSRFEKGQSGIHSSLAALLDYANTRDDEVVSQCAGWMRRTALSIVGRDWSGRLPMSEQIASFKLLRNTWGDVETAYIIAEPLSARARWVWDNGGYPDYADPMVQWELLFSELSISDDTDPLVTEKIRYCSKLCNAVEYREDSRIRDDILIWQSSDAHMKEIQRAARLEQIRRSAMQRTVLGRILTGRISIRALAVLFPQGSKRRKVAGKIKKAHAMFASGVWKGYSVKTLFVKGRSVLRRLSA